MVGKMHPGSRALILKRSGGDYKVLSPLDNSVGWVSGVQVDRVRKYDVQTRKPCK